MLLLPAAKEALHMSLPIADGVCQMTGKPAEVEQVDESYLRCTECGEVFEA